MSASAVFYKATHEKRYLDMSEQVFGNAIREWKKNEKLMHGKDDFFALQNLALAYEILQDNDRLPMGADEVMIRFADLHFDPDFVIDNSPMLRAFPIGKSMLIRCGTFGIVIKT